MSNSTLRCCKVNKDCGILVHPGEMFLSESTRLHQSCACTYVLYVNVHFFFCFLLFLLLTFPAINLFYYFFWLILLLIHLHLFSFFAEALHRSSLLCRSIHLTKHNCHPELIAYVSKIICQTATSSIT